MDHKPPFHPLYLAGFPDEAIVAAENSWAQLIVKNYMPFSKEEYFRALTNTMACNDGENWNARLKMAVLKPL